MGDKNGQAVLVSTKCSCEGFVGLEVEIFGAKELEQGEERTVTMTEATETQNTGISYLFPRGVPTTLLVSKNPLPILPSAGLAAPLAPTNNTVPEFLYQLTKMLTGGHNDIIEWSNGRIEVHNPQKLEIEVLQKYFRHSKFASFQRQLNYFGFRKIAGKGKMSPCSYVNAAATHELGSLLCIKRKPTTAPKEKNGRKHANEKSGRRTLHGPVLARTPNVEAHQVKTTGGHVAPSLGTVQLNEAVGGAPPPTTQQAIAQAAVGRGIRHSVGYGSSPTAAGATAALAADAQQSEDSTTSVSAAKFLIPMGVDDSLSQLANNYQNSLVDLPSCTEQAASELRRNGQQKHSAPTLPAEPSTGSVRQYASVSDLPDPFPSLLSRNSSLVDLAMIPTIGEFEESYSMPGMSGMNFVDFPQPEVDPTNIYVCPLQTQEQQQLEENKQQSG